MSLDGSGSRRCRCSWTMEWVGWRWNGSNGYHTNVRWSDSHIRRKGQLQGMVSTGISTSQWGRWPGLLGTVSTLQYNTIQYNTMNTVFLALWVTVRTLQYNAMNTVFSALWLYYNAIKYNAIQYNEHCLLGTGVPQWRPMLARWLGHWSLARLVLGWVTARED